MNCPNCADPRSSIRYRLEDYNLVACARCGLLHNDKFPPKKSKENTFSESCYGEVQSRVFQFHGDEYLKDPSAPIGSSATSRAHTKAADAPNERRASRYASAIPAKPSSVSIP
jgi:uncharacterized Zn finger protein